MEITEQKKIKWIKFGGFITAMIPLFSIAFSVFEYVQVENAYNKQKYLKIIIF